jgi:hypothetical protein
LRGSGGSRRRRTRGDRRLKRGKIRRWQRRPRNNRSLIIIKIIRSPMSILNNHSTSQSRSKILIPHTTLIKRMLSSTKSMKRRTRGTLGLNTDQRSRRQKFHLRKRKLSKRSPTSTLPQLKCRRRQQLRRSRHRRPHQLTPFHNNHPHCNSRFPLI